MSYFMQTNRPFTLADKCWRHLSSPTQKKSATFVGHILRNCKPTVDQSLQASQRSATPIRLARARSAWFYWQVADKNLCRRLLSPTNVVGSNTILRFNLPALGCCSAALLNKWISVKCDFNDFDKQSFERPSNRSRIVVVTTA